MTENGTRLPHAAAVMDLSGFGRCSLTVALPVLSAMGVQTSCMPTAVLSTHTGGFIGYTFRDFTEDMDAFSAHWAQEKLCFDALYVGYLGSPEQIGLVRRFVSRFKTPDNLFLLDPVMGDKGKLYSRFDDEMVRGIRSLVGLSTLTVPNMTEGAFLTGMPYRDGCHEESYLRDMLLALRELGAKQVLLTGVHPTENTVGAAWLEGDTLRMYAPEMVPAHYDGTGDVFASVLLGALLRGCGLEKSAALAADFTRLCIADTLAAGGSTHHGVQFEKHLWKLGNL